MTLAPDGGCWFDWSVAMARVEVPNAGIVVKEQCNQCHREVPVTVSGTCLDCVVTGITEPFIETG